MIAELQELGAWKSELIVKRYAHFAPEQLRTAADRLATFSLRSAKATPQESTPLSGSPTRARTWDLRINTH